MPTFGGLLKKKKTKDSAPPSSSPDTKKSNLSPVTSRTQTTNTTNSSTAAPSSTQAVVTTQPDLTDAKAMNNGSTQPTVANLVNPAEGTVDKAAPRQTKGKYTLTDFTIQRTLGTGSFGRVHLVQSKHNQRYYAVKVLKKQQVVKMKQIEHTNDERKMLQRVKHPFLITLWGTFQDSKNLYMVMDFIEGGELFSLLRKSQVSDNQLRLPAQNAAPRSATATPSSPLSYHTHMFTAIPKSCGKVLCCRSDTGN
jgi:protein kinase A